MYKIIGIVLCFIYALEAQELHGSPKLITREEWGARSPSSLVSALTRYPPSYIIIHHSDTESCTSQAACEEKVRSLQNYHMDHYHLSDIGFNFLIGEDGNVYEGRGWGKRGAHDSKFDAESIGICIIGTFTDREPNSAAIRAMKELIRFGIALNEIKSDYKLFPSSVCVSSSLFR